MAQSPNNVLPRDLPTTSLYLRDSLEASGLRIDWENCRSGPTSFRFGDRLVIVRYATGAEIDLARSIRNAGGRVLYLIDDDLEAIVGDEGLPADYRERTEAFLRGPWRALEELIDEVVVSSLPLAEKWRGRGWETVTQLDPYWPILPARREPVPAASPGVEVAWLCSRSHAADLESIADDLSRVRWRRRGAKLTVLCGKNRPAWLGKLPRVENLKPLSWSDYRRWLRTRHFDLALYPLLDTPVNRGRSINKFLEHAVAGAASIIPVNAPFADRLEPGDCCLAEAGAWDRALESLLADRDRLTEMAGRARHRARQIAESARVRQVEFWSQRLTGLAERAPLERVPT